MHAHACMYVCIVFCLIKAALFYSAKRQFFGSSNKVPIVNLKYFCRRVGNWNDRRCGAVPARVTAV